MKYALKIIDGNVLFLLRIKNRFVKNIMPALSAESIIKEGNLKKSNIKGFPINIDDKWYFEGKLTALKPKSEEQPESQKETQE